MKLTKKSILIAIVAMFTSLLALYIFSLVPSPLEAKAIQILENQTMWHEYQSEIEAKELEILELKALQEDIASKTAELRGQIELSFRKVQ